MIHLGVDGFDPLPFVTADPEGWAAIDRRLRSSVFLRSEGTVVTVGTPQVASPALVARCAEIARRFDRFYARAVAAYYTRPDLESEFLVNPLLAPLFELERGVTDGTVSATPLARLDCVLGEDGSLRVIEINSVGVNLMHIRSLMYLQRTLERRGMKGSSAFLAPLARAVVDGFARAYQQRHGSAPKRLVVGGVTPSGWFRATHLLFRDVFRSAGWEYVHGGPEQLDISGDTIRVAGQAVDVLWPDFLFYMAYQEVRYSQTKFPSAIGDYSSTPAQVQRIVQDERFISHLRGGRVVMLSPAAAYLALPKSLLAWIHDDSMPVPEEDRAWLAEHVARTYSARDRGRGVITLEQVLAQPSRFLIKPCQYGGSHGVLLGTLAAPDAWEAGVRTMWEDPTWVVQEYWAPVRTANGHHLSVGVQMFSGELGGIYLRTSESALVSARSSDFLPVVTG